MNQNVESSNNISLESNNDNIKTEIIRYENIIKNNYQIIGELKEYFKDINTITINGKGETAKYDSNALGINQAIIFSNKNFMFINDFISMFGIEEYIKNIKYVFCPDYPHTGHNSEENMTYNNVLSYLTKYGFTGKVFIYQLYTSFSS